MQRVRGDATTSPAPAILLQSAINAHAQSPLNESARPSVSAIASTHFPCNLKSRWKCNYNSLTIHDIARTDGGGPKCTSISVGPEDEIYNSTDGCICCLWRRRRRRLMDAARCWPHFWKCADFYRSMRDLEQQRQLLVVEISISFGSERRKWRIIDSPDANG